MIFLRKASKIIIIERDYQIKNKKKFIRFFDYKIMPAIVAVNHDAKAPPRGQQSCCHRSLATRRNLISLRLN